MKVSSSKPLSEAVLIGTMTVGHRPQNGIELFGGEVVKIGRRYAGMTGSKMEPQLAHQIEVSIVSPLILNGLQSFAIFYG